MTMPIDQIRFHSHNAFADAKANAEGTSETTPATLTAALLDFTNTLGGEAAQYIPVLDDPMGLYGFCSDGVEQKIRADGGALVLGWCIWEWPDAFVTAEFHAVWQDKDGNLYDITPKPNGETRILFVADRSYPQNFNFDDRPLNRRARLYQGPCRTARAREITANLAGTKLAYEERRATKAGIPLEEWMLRKVPHDPIETAIDAVLDLSDRSDAHFDTLGTSGFVEPDEKLMGLMKHRIEAQKHFAKLWRGR